MNNNNSFSRRRRGMRFKPKGGLSPNPQKPDREATQARADVVTEQGGAERVFEKAAYVQEIERSENIAAGLPAEGKPASRHSGSHTRSPPRLARPSRQPEEETFRAGEDGRTAKRLDRYHQMPRPRPWSRRFSGSSARKRKFTRKSLSTRRHSKPAWP
jgi:hypothetical protein